MADRILVRHPTNQSNKISFTPSRADAVRQALLLTYITIGWMTVEGAAALLLGWASKSLLLEAFGIDSVIELFSAAVLLWRLRAETSGAATSEHVILLSVVQRAWLAIRSMPWLRTSFSIPATDCLSPNG
jgi:hypothetical protein